MGRGEEGVRGRRHQFKSSHHDAAPSWRQVQVSYSGCMQDGSPGWLGGPWQDCGRSDWAPRPDWESFTACLVLLFAVGVAAHCRKGLCACAVVSEDGTLPMVDAECVTVGFTF